MRVEPADATSARGTVRGSGGTTYSVRVQLPEDLEAGVIEVACTCPHFERGHLCKHLWAFLLELGDAGPRVEGAGNIEVFDIFDDDLDSDAALNDASPFIDAGWNRLLAAAIPTRNPSREIHYIVALNGAEVSESLPVQLMERARSGRKGRLKSFSLRAEDVDGADHSVDGEALRALAACMGRGPGHYVSSYAGSPSFHTCPIAPGLQSLVLPLLARTGRLARLPAGREATVDQLVPLVWDAATRYEVCLFLDRNDEGTAWQLGARLSGPGTLQLADLDVVLSSGLAVCGDRIVGIEPAHLAEFVASLRDEGPLAIEASRIPEFLARVGDLGLPPVELPDELGWSEETGVPKGRLEIRRPTPRTPQAVLYAEVYFEYEGRRFRTLDTRTGFAATDRSVLVRRDLDAEQRLLASLDARGLRELPSHERDEADLQLPRRNMPEIVSALIGEGWDVEAEGAPVRQSSAPRLTVQTGIDWFELEGEVTFGDQVVPLPELLASAARGNTTIALSDGSVGVLPAEWLARVAPLAELGTSEGGQLRFLKSQALLVDTLLATQPEVDVDALFRETCQRIEQLGRARAVEAPEGLRGELRGYQKEGLGWLMHMTELGMGACLADDMGLGKTLQALALLAARSQARRAADQALPSLVVVPASLVHNWLAEAVRFTPDLSVLDYTGPGRAALDANFDDVDVVVTTYGTLRSDIAKLADRRFDCVVLDEAQAIKNPRTKISKVVRLLQSRQRIALSGTPVENHLGELWALFDFLNPGMLGPSARRAKTLDDADDETLAALGRALGPFILRRTKGEVLAELPPKTEQTLWCELEGQQKRLYQELLDHYRAALLKKIDADGMRHSQIQVLEALLRLRQAACHPGLVDPDRAGEGSAKLDLMQEQLLQALDEGHKAIVFSQFTSLLSLVRTRLDSAGITYEYLDGRTRKRGEHVARFQDDPDCRVFLISLKAGGQGLNLTAADYVFLLDPWWNPAVEAQAIDRAHRIGQSRPVFAYRLVARDTVEEKILELQDRKRRLADAIISGAAGGLRDLTREDLERLLE